jgi:hypothetical protein
LPGRSVSIAAPSSYWYLKQYPIKDIAKVVDYIVFITYDLHGSPPFFFSFPSLLSFLYSFSFLPFTFYFHYSSH